jgi:hypothetical protein
MSTQTPPSWLKGQGFPLAKSTLSSPPGNSCHRSNRRTTTTPRDSQVPRRPHNDQGDRPTPEPVARPPTNLASTFQGRHPGFPTLHSAEQRKNEELCIEISERGTRSRPTTATDTATRETPPTRGHLHPPWLQDACTSGRRWAQQQAWGHCTDPESWQSDQM